MRIINSDCKSDGIILLNCKLPNSCNALSLTGNLVQLSSTSLVFGMGTTSACVTVSTIDNNVADGSRNASLTLTASGPAQSTVPVELFPNTITVMILDNDRKYEIILTI